MDRTFQLTRNGLVAAGGPYTSTFTIPFASNPEYKDNDAMYGFEMTTVYYSSGTSDYGGFYKHAYGIPVVGGSVAGTAFPLSGTADQIFGMAGSGTALSSVTVASSGGNLVVTLNFAASASATRYYRCWINVFSSDNVNA